MDGAGHHRRRPRPVADAPAVDAVAVAKAWLLALVADAPLAQAGAVPAAELARSGPELCGAVLAALASDAELDRLLCGDGRAPVGAAAARLTGARTPAALAAGVEALRSVAWRALRAELRDPLPELVADLADRLAYVCARVAEAGLTDPGAEPPGRGEGPLADALAGAFGAPRAAAPPPPAAAVAVPGWAPPSADPAPAPAAPSPPPPGVEVVDLPSPATPDADPLVSLAEELAADGVAEAPAAPAPAAPAPAAPAPADVARVTRRRAVDTSWHDATEAGPPWLAAITRRLERREQDGLPFAVLVVEVDDLDRLLASQSGREVAFALEAAERGLTAELAPADLVVRERLGRWWLTSPDRDGAAARDLGTRVAAAIARAVLGGAPLAASVGVAVCPDDGATLETLAGYADEGMFAARAAGLPIA